jgi:hypothetical protein
MGRYPRERIEARLRLFAIDGALFARGISRRARRWANH